MNRKKAAIVPYLMLLFALIGTADAFYDSYKIYNSQMLWCPQSMDGCNTVANSPYARIFDVPLGYFGVIFYLYMSALAALLAFDPFSRGLRLGALIYTATGVSFSIYFLYLEVAVIHAFCIYCMISAVMTLLLLLAALAHFRATRPPAVPG
ncbi:MAG: vitamin K epoxide reductase family protein [Dissulfurispiraceae bacterium]|jgi:uncharacterized membrane protein